MSKSLELVNRFKQLHADIVDVQKETVDYIVLLDYEIKDIFLHKRISEEKFHYKYSRYLPGERLDDSVREEKDRDIIMLTKFFIDKDKRIEELLSEMRSLFEGARSAVASLDSQISYTSMFYQNMSWMVYGKVVHNDFNCGGNRLRFKKINRDKDVYEWVFEEVKDEKVS